MNRWISGTHLGQNLFGRNPAIHHPNPFGFPIELFDSFEKTSQGRFIRGVAGHDFICQGKALRGHHQRNNHLHAIGPLVAAVTKFAFVSFTKGRVTFKIRAGQIIQQQFELHSKQILPASPQMFKKLVPVLEQLVQTPIQIVFLGQTEIFFQQIGHRTVLKPLSMQAPFAARINQPISG